MISGLLSAAVVIAAVPLHRTVDTVALRPGETLAEVLAKLAVPLPEATAALAKLSDVVKLSKIRAGDGIRIERDLETRPPRLTFLEVHEGAALEWAVRHTGDGFTAFKRDIPVTRSLVHIDTVLNSTLSQAFLDVGQDPQLAIAVADVFAWDVDFYTDPRKGDHIRALVERSDADGHCVGYGQVIAAEYEGGAESTLGDKTVFRYMDNSGELGYYDAQGQSARRAFLKSPLKFSRISSGFGLRMHPVLHYVKEHEGIDYVAPTGTPVWAVGDGTVEAAGYKGANGKFVAIKHRNGLETFYCHLSAIGAGIKAGVHVMQKRLIGLVGMTGRATGPHLHYALKRAGQFINPLSLKFPKTEPLPAAELPDFFATVVPLLEKLRAAPPKPAIPPPEGIAAR